MAELGFQVSLQAAQTPGVSAETDWLAHSRAGRLQQTLGRFQPRVLVSVNCDFKDETVSIDVKGAQKMVPKDFL